ncbi:archaetidylserine decarboxylase [Porticoccaceae bacterium]|nr:archaetidylserine decarboxylase [Porticoccaceae bacterium]
MNHQAELFVALQRLLPQHLLSRLIARAAESKLPWLKNLLIKRAIAAFDINISEAASSDIHDYENFNDFFTRALKEGARPMDQDSSSLVSPADGAVSQAGPITQQRIIQAKGSDYSAGRLLGNSEEAKLYEDGAFTTIYLSPKDYHRVHMPIAGTLVSSRYIPGDLFSVNDKTAQALPGLFARNERLVCQFDSELGQFALVFVGAMLVAGIETVWGGFETPGRGAVRDADFSGRDLSFDKGEEIGRFKFGSTVILLFQKDKIDWQDSFSPQAVVQMGEKIASFK